MDKKIAVFLSDYGWSHAKIGRRFEVSRSLICQIVRRLGRYKDSVRVRCEACGKPIEKGQGVKIKTKTTPLLICNDCQKELQKNY